MNELFNRHLEAMLLTEHRPLPEIQKNQLALIERIVRHAYNNVPYYRGRLACLFNDHGAFDFSRWSEVPVLDRDQAMVHTKEMRAATLQPGLGKISEFRTTGTSGEPLWFTTNDLARVAYNAALTRAARAFGVKPSQPLAQIRVFRGAQSADYPEGLSWKGWSMADGEAPSYGLDLRTPVRQQIEWLLRKRCANMMTSPSNAMAISYAIKPLEAKELGVKYIFSVGETVIPGARELVAERLGATLIGIYSCEEIGYIATECPTTQNYHVVMENTYIEVVDERGLPAQTGHGGRVLVTGLFNYAQPFIRYDIGDVVVLSGKPCPCGRTLPVISEIIGRKRNAFVFKDGTRAWPRVWDARAMKALVPCREFQIVQVDFEMVEFRYVADGTGREPDIAGLNAYAYEHLHPSVSIVAIPLQALNCAPGVKHEPFVSELLTE